MLEQAVKGGKPHAALEAWRSLKSCLQQAARFLFVCLVSLILVTAAARQAKGQDAQMAVTSLSIKCADKTYQLGLASVPARLKAAEAKALGIILISPQGKDSKMFFVYWLDPAQLKPTKRDDNGGWDGKKLYEYSKETIGSFITKAQCNDNPQVVEAISGMIDTASREDQVAALAERLKQKMADVGEIHTTQERMAAAEFTDELSFSKAAHEFVLKSLPVPADCPTQLAAAQKEAQEWRKRAGDASLKTQELQKELDKRPIVSPNSNWLVWIMLGLGLLFIAVLVVQYLYYKEQLKKEEKRNDSSGKNDGLSEAEDRLNRIYYAATQLAPELERAKSLQGNPQTINKSLKALLAEVRQYLFRHVLNDEIKSMVIASSERVMKAAKPEELGVGAQVKATAGDADQVKKTEEETEAGSQTGSVASQAKENQSLPEPQAQDAHGVTGPGLPYTRELDRQLAEITLTPKSGPLFPRLDKLEAGISEMWSLCANPGETYTEESLDKLIRSAKNALSLANGLSRQFNVEDRNAETVKTRVDKLLAELNRMDKEWLADMEADGKTPVNIVKKLQEKLASLKAKVDLRDNLVLRLTEMKGDVEPLMNPKDKDFIEAAGRIVKDYSYAINQLPGTQDGKGSLAYPLLSVRISNQQAEIKLATKAITEELNTKGSEELNTKGSSIGKLVTELITQLHMAQGLAGEAAGLRTERDELQRALDEAEPQAEWGRELANGIAAYLHFDTEKMGSDGQAIKQIRDLIAGEPVKHHRIRLRFSAAVLAFDEAMKDGCSQEVLQLLRIEKIKKNMEGFLTKLEGLSDEALWEDGLRQGFIDQWLHDLLRADLLLRNYLNTPEGAASTMTLDSLSDAIYQASEAVITTLCKYDVEVNKIDLFKTPRRVIAKIDPAEELLKIPAAVAKVKEHVKSSPGERFVVDVVAFPVWRRNEEIAKGFVTIANPSDWLEQ